jgi:hypothetical protein
MASFMLIPRDVPQDFADVSPEDMQRIIEKYVAWGNRLEAAGKLQQGQKLRDGEGRVMRGTGGKISITDGPFSETKEVVGGYWLIEAAGYDEAVELARDCPHMEYGASLEIRQVEAV